MTALDGISMFVANRVMMSNTLVNQAKQPSEDYVEDKVKVAALQLISRQTVQWMRWVLCLVIVVSTASCTVQPTYPKTDHFDGRRFFNSPPILGMSTKQLLNHVVSGHSASKWNIVDVKHRRATRSLDSEGWSGTRITFINHATVLIQVGGVSILTDPVWSDRVGPFAPISVKRVRPPAVHLDQLPKIDVVVISHNHYDHMDLPTLRRLHERDNPLFLVPLGNTPLFWKNGIRRVFELDWWQSHWFSNEVEIVFTPARHQAGRAPWNINKSLWGGFVVRHDNATVYFAGDTAYGSHFNEIKDRFEPIDIALLPIGAYKPRKVHRSVHLDPSDAFRAHKDLEARRSIPIHYGTFQLTQEYFHEPIDELKRILAHHGEISSEFVVLPEGATFHLEDTSSNTAMQPARE